MLTTLALSLRETETIEDDLEDASGQLDFEFDLLAFIVISKVPTYFNYTPNMFR